ncbi:MAG: transcription elongation factor subunit Spt4 [Candidatus Bathyarchaeia archaeon]
MMVERACRRCHYITEEKVCPNCKSTDLSEDFSGLVIIFDPKNSAIAKVMKIEKKGRYAIKVR